MTQYRCAKCRTLLESDDGQVGQTDACPLCGQENVVPTPREGKPGLVIGIIAAGVGVVLLAVVLAVALPSGGGSDGGPANDPLAEALDDMPDAPPIVAVPEDMPELGAPAPSEAATGRGGEDSQPGDESPGTPTASADPKVQAELDKLKAEIAKLKEGEADDEDKSPDLEGPKLEPQEVAAKAMPAVFLVHMFDAQDRRVATGSGFFISSEGLAVTNYHVINGTHSMCFILTNGARYYVNEALAVDPLHDLALVKVDGRGLDYLELREGPLPRQLTEIVAIGSPGGEENTTTSGTISRYSKSQYGWTDIQFSAEIEHGSSGGPLLTLDAKVVGVNYAGIGQRPNVNFAIPVGYVHELLANRSRPKPLSAFQNLRGIGSDPVGLEAARAGKSIDAGRTDEALAVLEPLVAGKGADHIEVWYMFGKALRRAERYDEALAAQHKAIALGDESGRCHLQIARIRVAQEKYRMVRPAIEAALEAKYADPGDWYYVGDDCRSAAYTLVNLAKSRKRQLTPADELDVKLLTECADFSLTRATSLPPRDPVDVYYIGLSFRKLGQYEAAASCFEGAISMDGQYAAAYRMLAFVLARHLGEPARAVECMTTMLARCGEPSITDVAALGEYAEQAKMYETAVKAYSLMIMMMRQANREIASYDWHKVGRAFFGAGQYSEAAGAFQLAVATETRPEDLAERYVWLSMALRCAGEYDEAVNAANEAMNRGYDKSMCYWHLAECYRLAGDRVRANRYYKSCVQTGAKNALVDDARKKLAANP